MKIKVIAIALFALTVATIVYYPIARGTAKVYTPISGTQPHIRATQKIEVVFVLDTTSSMSGLIDAAKEKIWSIATTMTQAQTAPEIHMGLVAFRDRGDAYVTRVVDLSEDLDTMYATLMDFRAQGGGDGPESVNQALYDAVHKISWSQDSDSYKVIFLVGDAPAHMDYIDDVKYPVTVANASKKGIVINTIRCGEYEATQTEWARIAQLSQGKYFDVDQHGGALAMSTPYDTEIAKLAAELDDTRLFFGTEDKKILFRLKMAATEKLHELSSPEAQARRARFNSSASGKGNFLGDSELVAAFEADPATLEALPEEQLPDTLMEMNKTERREYVEELSKKRDDLMGRIEELNQSRSSYIEEKVEEMEDADMSLDHKIYRAVKEQAAEKGLVYEDGPAY